MRTPPDNLTGSEQLKSRIQALVDFSTRRLGMFHRLANRVVQVWARIRFRYDFFLSHAHADARGYSRELWEQLESLGVSCFLDSSELPAGASLTPGITQALRRSAGLIVVASPGAAHSDWVKREIKEFSATHRSIIPIVLGPLQQSLEPLGLDTDVICVVDDPNRLITGEPGSHVAPSIEHRLNYVRRRVVIGFEIALVAAAFIGGAIIARVALQRQVAATVTAANRALTLRLVEDAGRVAGVDPLLGLRLALEALDRAPVDDPATIELTRARVRDLMASGRIARVDIHPGATFWFFDDVPAFIGEYESEPGELRRTFDGQLIARLPNVVTRVARLEDGGVGIADLALVFYDKGPSEIRRLTTGAIFASGAIYGERVNRLSGAIVIGFDDRASELRSETDGHTLIRFRDQPSGRGSSSSAKEPLRIVDETDFPLFVVGYGDQPDGEIRSNANWQLMARLTRPVEGILVSADRSIFAIEYKKSACCQAEMELRRTSDAKPIDLPSKASRIVFGPWGSASAIVFDNGSGEIRVTGSDRGVPLGAKVKDIQFLADGGRVFVDYTDRAAEIRSIDGTIVATLKGRIKESRASRTRRLLFVAYEEGGLEVLRTSDGTKVLASDAKSYRFPSPPDGIPSRFSVLPQYPVRDTSRLFLVELADSDASQPETSRFVAIHEDTQSIAFDESDLVLPEAHQDGSDLYVKASPSSRSQGKMWRLRTDTGHAEKVNYGDCHPTYGWIDLATRDGKFRLTPCGELIQASPRKIIAHLPAQPNYSRTSFSPTSTHVFVCFQTLTDRQPPCELRETATGQIVTLANAPRAEVLPEWSPNGRVLFLSRVDDGDRMLLARDGKLLTYAARVEFRDDGEYGVLTLRDQRMELWKIDDAPRRIADLGQAVKQHHFSESNRLLVNYNDGSTYVVDLDWLAQSSPLAESADKSTLTTMACSRIAREALPRDWPTQFLPSDRPHPVCGQP